MTITRMEDGTFLVVTGDILADLRPLDAICVLNGNVLRTRVTKGHISVMPVVVVKLGPDSFAKVTALQAGETVEV
jgi:hypothetical protein